MADRRGRFITLEGSEGAGKSSAAEWLEEQLLQQGRSVRRTREPGGTEMAEAIRNVLLAKRSETVDPITECLLMFAARRQHVVEVIVPALDAGHDVICDRFTDATRAYQGSGRGLASDLIETLADWVHPTANPDLSVFFDVPVETGLARAASVGEPDRIEREQAAFFERVTDGYRQLAVADPGRWVVIDASDTLEGVRRQLEGMLGRLLGTEP